jgi:hypothetical protein
VTGIQGVSPSSLLPFPLGCPRLFLLIYKSIASNIKKIRVGCCGKTCNSSSGEAKKGGSQVQIQPGNIMNPKLTLAMLLDCVLPSKEK